MRKDKKIYGYLVIILAFISFAEILNGCSGWVKKEHKKEIFALDTIITFTVYGGKNAETAIDNAVDRVKEIENRMSTTIDTSDVSIINQYSGKNPVKVHNDTFYVIEKAVKYGKKTDGAFDITIYPIVKLWNIKADSLSIPTNDEIKRKLALVDYKSIVMDKNECTVYLKKEGMGIDLGAIAKGYAADEVAHIFTENGVEHALINMGGNIVAIGSKPDGKPWRIGIRDPRREETGQDYLGILDLADKSVVSSGDYERYMVELYKRSGKRYHHIFDPKTGFPAQSGLIATTILADSSIDADALSTCLFIMGSHKGFKLLDEMENVSGIAITSDKEVLTTKKLNVKLAVTAKEYKIKK